MKVKKGVLETVLTTTAELVENTAKFKLRELASLVFALRRNKLQLLEAESAPPGREVAYIAKARDVFRTE